MTSKEKELTIKVINNKKENGFAVCFCEYRIGYKYDVGPGRSGKSFPDEVTECHKDLNDAVKAMDRMIEYIRDVVEKIKRKKNPTNSSPSYYLWE